MDESCQPMVSDRGNTMRDQLKRLVAETSLWTGANAVAVGAAMIGAYLLSGAAFGTGVLSVGLVLAALTLSLTWGSWVSLNWTRSHGLRAAQKAVTLFPGFLLMGTGAFGFYVGFGSLIFWGLLTISAFGTLASAVLLWRYFPRYEADITKTGLASGFLLYPFLTVFGAGVIGALWWWYLAEPVHTDWRNLFQLSTVFVSVLAVELCTTIVPAAMAMVCHQLNALGDRTETTQRD